MELMIREIQDSDDIEKLTELIRSAYSSHAASGLKYWATHQTVDDTKRRIAMGICLVALHQDEYVGTCLFRRPQPESPVELYRSPRVWTVAQFGVLPEHKGKGIGKAIHARGLALLKQMGVATIALDTAEPAKPLIEMYKSWGYQLVGHCDWRPFTNYPSVVMSMAVQ
ncbi:GNAT family N-acetyltransferase [Cellvibrio sp. UBA7661]|uniref:GNAT family N-acetyltransferase n=1 Tax=Cellvibrio sp. UBA7661 TaxID=1946311 RepID=UPI002F3581E5